MWLMKCLFLCYLLILKGNVKCVVVRIQNGLVSGYENKTVGQNHDYISFRGIPYAQPPIGELRFEPPVPKVNWNGILDARNDGNICVQGFLATGNEDCLFINVYVPGAKVTTFNLLPTMVFIHGGGFENGNANYASYGPDFLLEKGIIVVTFNYRLGIFGFLSTGDLVASGNNGMKDQVLALQWVRNNIKYFGGDSSKVTIFGESAGAASVSYHMQSPLSKGLFWGAIMQSGVTLCSWSLSRRITETIRTIAQILSVNTSNSRTLVNEFKKINYKHLQYVSFKTQVTHYMKNDPRQGLVFGPVVEPDSDSAFFTGKSHESLQNGKVSTVPCIVGYNSLEVASFFGSNYSILLQLYMQQYLINSTKFIPIDLNVHEDKVNATAAAIKHKYIEYASSVTDIVKIGFIKFLSDDCFARPIIEFARLVAKFSSTYLYVFSYEGDLGLSINRTYLGVGHAEELRYIWRMGSALSDPSDIAIRDKMVSMWTNFAKNCSPDDTKWKKVDKDLSYLDIDKKLTLKPFPQKEEMKFWYKLYKDKGNPPYDTF